MWGRGLQELHYNFILIFPHSTLSIKSWFLSWCCFQTYYLRVTWDLHHLSLHLIPLLTFLHFLPLDWKDLKVSSLQTLKALSLSISHYYEFYRQVQLIREAPFPFLSLDLATLISFTRNLTSLWWDSLGSLLLIWKTSFPTVSHQPLELSPNIYFPFNQNSQSLMKSHIITPFMFMFFLLVC